MSPAGILAISIVAFLSAPAAFLLLWLLYLRTGDAGVRDLSMVTVSMALLLLGNFLAALAGGYFGAPSDGRIYLLLLDEVTVASVMLAGFLCHFAHVATRTPVTPGARLAFWATAFIWHAAALSAAVLARAPEGGFDVRAGFTVTTCGPAAMLTYATLLLLARRRSVERAFLLPHPERFFLLFLPFTYVSVANDLFQFGERLGGSAIPLSPFFTLVVNGLLIVLCVRRLAPGDQGERASAGRGSPYRLTVRETEILPLLLDGASNDEIGERLCISPHTVKNHVTAIFRKTGAENRFDLLKTLGPDWRA